MEIVVPLAYAISFVLAYYGPNSEILGNVGNDCWQYEKVTNVGTFFTSLCQMFFLDLMSGIIGGILLWKFCSINALQEGCRMLNSYWAMVAIKFAQRMTMVSLNYF